ncbi:hypothetical protein [Nonomuraea fuscirosea]
MTNVRVRVYEVIRIFVTAILTSDNGGPLGGGDRAGRCSLKKTKQNPRA